MKKLGGGGKICNNFFLKQEILGTKFWMRDSCEEEISPAKIVWRNLCL